MSEKGQRGEVEALFDYIENLTLSQGRFEGQPFRLHPWEKRFIRGAFSTDGDAALDGPLDVNHAETVVAASSFN